MTVSHTLAQNIVRYARADGTCEVCACVTVSELVARDMFLQRSHSKGGKLKRYSNAVIDDSVHDTAYRLATISAANMT